MFDFAIVRAVSITFFLLMAAPGMVPVSLALLREVPASRLPWVITREMIFALLAILLMAFAGEAVLKSLGLHQFALQCSGGVVLFLIALRMIFPGRHALPAPDDPEIPNEEPFIVPLAIPLLAGPATLSAAILYGAELPWPSLALGIALAWLASLGILLSGNLLRRAMGIRGLMATERLMGLILSMLAVEMLLAGVHAFLLDLSVDLGWSLPTAGEALLGP